MQVPEDKVSLIGGGEISQQRLWKVQSGLKRNHALEKFHIVRPFWTDILVACSVATKVSQSSFGTTDSSCGGVSE